MCLNEEYQTKFVPKEDPIYTWKVFRKDDTGKLINLFADMKIIANTHASYWDPFEAIYCPKFEFKIGNAYTSRNIDPLVVYKGFHAYSTRKGARDLKNDPFWYDNGITSLIIRKVKLWGKVHFDEEGQIVGQFMEITNVRG